MAAVIAFVSANLAVVCGLLYFAVDLAILLNPAWKANGILHSVQLFLGSKSGQPPVA